MNKTFMNMLHWYPEKSLKAEKELIANVTSKSLRDCKQETWQQYCSLLPQNDHLRRFKFWSSDKRGQQPVLFWTYQLGFVEAVDMQDSYVKVVQWSTGTVHLVNFKKMIPIFWNRMLPVLAGQHKATKSDVQQLVQFRQRFRQDPNLVNEKMDDLEETKTFTVNKQPDWDTNPFEKFTVSMQDAARAMNNFNKVEILEETNMTKATNIKNGMVETNKEALKAVGFLNAGRASNKVIKEAMRPLLMAMFKPTFMQSMAMKLTGMQNPVEKALEHEAADLFCAELAQLIIELRGVENEDVREVTKAGITYAGVKLSDKVPFEDAIDDVVAKLEEGAAQIIKKVKK